MGHLICSFGFWVVRLLPGGCARDRNARFLQALAGAHTIARTGGWEVSQRPHGYVLGTADYS